MATIDILTSTPLDLVHEDVSYCGMSLTVLRDVGLPPAAQLAGARDYLKAQVDLRAEQLRGKVLTTGSGQALEYQEVQLQATAALADPAKAIDAAFPMLAATIGVDVDPQTHAPAADVLGVARSVTAAYTDWLAIGAAIRAARLKGKAAIDAATTIEDAAGAFDTIAWPALPN